MTSRREGVTCLAGHGVGLADLVAPVAPPNRDDRQLGQDDGATDSGGHFLGALHPQAHMTVVVANGNEGLHPHNKKQTVNCII